MKYFRLLRFIQILGVVNKPFYAFVMMSALISVTCVSNASFTSTEPSFSCLSPTKIEKVICTDPSLATKDRTMSVLYAAARTSALGNGLSREEDEQRKWLKSRDQTCLKEKNSLNNCLNHQYDSRLKDLAVAALFQTPNLALAELARQDSKTSPIYEAIYRYATLENPIERTKVINPLIHSAFDSVHDEEWSLLKDTKTVSDVVADDGSFAAFLDTVSVSDYDLTLPCAAMIHRPGLVDALGAKYGGAVDNHLIYSDCGSTLPATPKFFRLMAKADSVQPPCDGTIRFSQGREYDKILNAISLHRIDLLGEDNDEDIDEVDPRFYQKHQAEIEQAVVELSQYYVEYFHVIPSTAHEDAQSAVDSAIHAAFGICF
ncbi:MAG: hypothetical protein KGO49_02485 [Gammaproteobacteria bacterium]|nr:hypothetical protein [Gammaproteobacteria bacterium]